LARERVKLRELVSLLATTEDRERQRLAALLHDEVTQLLATSRFKLESLAADVGEPYTAAFDELREMHDRALEVTRTLTVELSPPVLQLGLAPALAWLADHFETRRGVAVSFTTRVQKTGLPPQTEILLFVAARELIHNVRKHAGPAATTRIELSRKGSDILLRVEDDGIGMDSEVTLATTSGYGLFSIRQRVESLSGHVIVESQPSRGTRVTITCPA
jgi:signal transduction histidine kinase